MRLPTLATRALLSLLTGAFCHPAHAQAVQRIIGPVNQLERSTLIGSPSAKLARATDEGPIQPGQMIGPMRLMLRPSAEQQVALEKLLKEQQDRTSPNYHRWLSPEEYATRFGAAKADIEILTSWLAQQGFTRIEVSHTRRFLSFTGIAAVTQKAFATELHRVLLDGRRHFANITAPSVPSAFAGLVSTIIGLDDFPAESFHRSAAPAAGGQTQDTASYFTPADFAAFYDLGPLTMSKIDGTGVKIVVVGQADPDIDNLHKFQTMFGFALTSPTVILAPGSSDPGIVSPGDVDEAALDLEWVSAVAPGATVIYEYAANAVTQAMMDAIDDNRGQIISVSFGDCEPIIMETPELSAGAQSPIYDVIQAGSLMGMTVVAASGDQGAAGCEQPRASASASTGLAVDFPASAPEVTAVGGTQFRDSTFTATATSSYVAEAGWNDMTQNTYLAASGGGASLVFMQPAWQDGEVVPSGGFRYVPDIALYASDIGQPYEIITNTSNGQPLGIGGTSAATASFAGILALVQQSLNSDKILARPGLGYANPVLYELAKQVTDNQAGTNSIFHDVTSGSNMVPCTADLANCSSSGLFGFQARSGYDEVTGLGSVDADQLVKWWGYLEGTPQLSASPLGASFITQAAGTTSDPIAFTLSNNGNGLLSIPSSIVFTGTNAASFAVKSDTCGTPKQLLPGSSCVVNVTFTPTAPGGPESALMTINSNDAGSPMLIPLTGIGTAPIETGSFPTTSPFTTSTGYGGGPIIQAFDGNFYGVNAYGGDSAVLALCPGNKSTQTGGGCGTIFELTAAGTYNVLHSFMDSMNSSDGTDPMDGAFPSSFIQGPDGNFYGTALSGGLTTQCDSGCGTLFELTPGVTPVFRIVYTFGQTTSDGQNPSSLTLGADGNIYGTTLGGGANGGGTIFAFAPGSSALLKSFSLPGGTSGSYPQTLVQGSDGLFYGMTQEISPAPGQANDFGSVFQIDTSGNYKTLYAFQKMTDSANIKKASGRSGIVKTQPSHSQNGDAPPAVYATSKALVEYRDGSFYGTTASPQYDKRTVFQITPAGALSTLYTFTSTSTSSGDGGGSLYGLTLGSDGNFYGTSGDFLFRMTPGGRLFSLYQVPQDTTGNPPPPVDPQPGFLLYAADGSFVDATTLFNQNDFIGGSDPEAYYCSSNCGYVFDYVPTPTLAAPVQIFLSSSTVPAGNPLTIVPVGTPVTINWQALEGYSLTAQQCYAYLSGGAGGGSWGGKLTGSVNAATGIYQGVATITPMAPGNYSYAITCGGTQSASATLAVIQASPTVLLTSSPSKVGPDAQITLTATVSNPSGAGPVPTGLIEFESFHPFFPPIELVNGVATMITTAVVPGSEDPTGPTTSLSFSANYFGDSNYTAGTGYIDLQLTSLAISTLSVQLDGAIGTEYSTTLTATGGVPPYRWGLAEGMFPPGLSISTVNNKGIISGMPKVAGMFSFVVYVEDSTGASTTNFYLPFEIGIGVGLSAAFVPSDIQAVGSYYSGFFIIGGGAPPYTFQKTSGSLPAGLSLLSNGNIVGTPTSPGTSTFTVALTDSESSPASITQSIAITIAPAALSISPASLLGQPFSLPGGSIGNYYSMPLVAAGGVAPYHWIVSSGSLPSKFTLDATSGVISGPPSQTGTSTFTVQVSDTESTPMSATSTLSITIDPTLAPATSSLPSGVVGSTYIATLDVSGGVNPDTWRRVSGALPAGISLSPTTGVLSGIPTESGTFPFIVLVSDSEASPSSAILTYTLNVAPALAITSTALPATTVSAPYSAPIAMTGGVPGYQWSVAPDALPAGLQLDKNTGVIYGNATKSGTSVFAVQVTDSESTPVSVSNIFCIGVSTSCSLRFVPIAPCRAADTRGPVGTFGAPELGSANIREFDLPQSACGIPSTALAYSVNVTVIPDKILRYLTLWPTGAAQPNASTLNSYDGRVKANAAIVPAGSNGGVDVFVSDGSQVILDVDGYFVLADSNAGLSFYPLPPCRVADTRGTTAPLGGPFLAGQSSRSFPVQSSSCGIPATAQAYSLNVTAIPHNSLGYLTTWPTGQSQPNVSTLNAPTGTITANAAIVPAGTSGAVSIFVSDDADVILDIDGYFAPQAGGGLSLYAGQPCRVLDTRNDSGAFNGVLKNGVQVEASACALPAAAQAYVLNATVVPPGPLVYLTLWPDGENQPDVSTLNANDAAITSNMAIVPTANGKVDVFSSNPTQLILDSIGYFAP